MQGIRYVVLIGLMSLAGGASAVDRMNLFGGIGAEHIGPPTEGDAYRLALAWSMDKQWQVGRSRFAGEWELSAGTLRHPDTPENDTLDDVGFSAVVRAPAALFEGDQNGAFLEFAFGVHYLSDKEYADRRTGSHLQFGSQAGVGFAFKGGRFQMGYRFIHLSNAGLWPPNGGFNFHLLHVGTGF